MLQWLSKKTDDLHRIKDPKVLAKALRATLHALPAPLNTDNQSSSSQNPIDAIPLISVVSIEISHEEKSSEESKSNQRASVNLCRNCLTNPANCVFFSCGHVYSCFDCAQQYKTCPSCGFDIRDRVKMEIPN